MDATLSKRHTMASHFKPNGSQFSLVQKTEGIEIAGSGERYTPQGYGVLYKLKCGTNGGRWFNTLAEAVALYKETGGEVAY